VKWVCHSIAFGSYLIPLKVTSYCSEILKTRESPVFDSTPNNKIGLNANHAVEADDVLLPTSSINESAILGIVEVATY